MSIYHCNKRNGNVQTSLRGRRDIILLAWWMRENGKISIAHSAGEGETRNQLSRNHIENNPDLYLSNSVCEGDEECKTQQSESINLWKYNGNGNGNGKERSVTSKQTDIVCEGEESLQENNNQQIDLQLGFSEWAQEARRQNWQQHGGSV